MDNNKNGNLVKSTDIEATLTDGQMFVSKNWARCSILCLILSMLVLTSALVMIIGTPLVDGSYDELLSVIIGTSFVGIVCTFASVILRVFVVNGRKKIKIWLNDAAILDAYSEAIGETLVTRYPFFLTKATAIQVTFNYDGKRYTYRSEYKGALKYLRIYSKFANKDITIAYSAKYDKVMLINPRIYYDKMKY